MTVIAPQPLLVSAPERDPRRARTVLAVCSIAVFVVFLDTTIVNIAFDAIRTDFRGTSTASLSWVLNAYAVVFAALLVPAGRLADQQGRRRVFLTGLLGFGLTSAACGLATSVGALVAFRALQAATGALLVPTSLALLLPEFPVEKRSTAVGAWGAMGGLAAATGPVVGALLTEHLSWRWVFFVNVPVTALAWWWGRSVLRETRDEAASGLPDLASVVLVVLVPGAFALGLVQGSSEGWTTPLVLASFAVAALGLPVLVQRTLRARDPLVDPRLFRARGFGWANAGNVFFAASFYGTVLLNVLFLQRVWHWSVLTTALAITPSPVVATLLSPVSGRLADRFGHRALLVPGSLAMLTGQLWLVLGAGGSPSYAGHWLPAAVLIGTGIGLAFPTFSAAAVAALPPDRFALGSAINSSFRQIGAVLGISVGVAVLGSPAPLTALHAFHRTWLALGVASLLAALTSLGIPRTGDLRQDGGPAPTPTTL